MNKITINEENKYNTTAIAKWIRQTLKEEFKDLKFSVTKESYSMGSSINLSVMKSDKIRFLKTFEEVTETEILSLMNARNDTEEEVKNMIKQQLSSKHTQINQYHLNTSWDLTEEGKQVLNRIVEIANKYNWDNSDSQTDYFDVNYYLHLNLGKWDKPFIDGTETPKKETQLLLKLDKAPRNWIKTEGATTTPNGYQMFNNGKSRFSGERKSVLVKETTKKPESEIETLQKELEQRLKEIKQNYGDAALEETEQVLALDQEIANLISETA